MYDIYDNDFDKAFDEAVDAIEKKEHRLIWADALKKHYAWWKGGSREMTMDEAKSDFDTIIDLQPTVEPTKHGRWIPSKDEEDTFVCSNCLEPWVLIEGDPMQNGMNYCPNCGARMDAQIGEDKSHPFAESVMMGMDEVEE